METLTPESPRWGEFTERLGGPEGVNFTEDGKFTCDNSNLRPLAVAILDRMGGIDINKTLEYFSAHGGHCDCEILFNVDPHNDEDETYEAMEHLLVDARNLSIIAREIITFEEKEKRNKEAREVGEIYLQWQPKI